MHSGTVRIWSRARMGTKVATARTIVCLLMRCFGCYGRARHGAISIRHLDTGTVCSNALIGGPARAFGIVFSRPWQPIQISSRSCSMPPSSGHTSIRPAQKGDSKSGDRALARRLEYQDPHCRRCAWSSDADDPHRRPSTRGHSGQHPHRGPHAHQPHRRQGIRQRRLPQRTRGGRSRCRDPAASSRTAEIAYDKNAYGLRYRIECFINKIKHYRRVATRYEKTARNFLSMVSLAAVMVWLRDLV